MAITPLNQSLLPAPPRAITPVPTESKSDQEAHGDTVRREMLLMAELETGESLDATSVDNHTLVRTGMVPEVSTPPSATEASPPGEAANATKASLSAAGRLIDQLLHLAQKEEPTSLAQGKTPLLISSDDAKQVAMALQSTLEQMGQSDQAAQADTIRRALLLLTELETNPEAAPVGHNAAVASARLAQELSTVQLAAEPNPSAGEANANTASLSAAGRLINQLLHIAQKEESPLSVQGKNPILASPPTPDNTHQAAMALKKTLDQSGLFYESHIVEWMNNQRPLADLMKEPQAQLSSLQPTTDTPSTSSPIAPDNFNSNLAQIVNQQLNVLEQNRIVWQGEIWPGQQMVWEVSEETDRRGEQEGAGEVQSVWCSDLRFDLPSLGAVAARVSWSGGHVRVQVRTEHEPVASSLRAHGAQLASALDSAGSTLDALQVQLEGVM